MMTRGDKTKKAILEASRTLFSRKGFKDVSMSDICESTGLSRGGLYRHYSSTGVIFKELLAEDYSFDEQIGKGESALTILESTLRYVEDELMRDENSMSLAIYEFANVGENHGYFTTVETRARNRWMRLIEYGMRTGEFMKVDAGAVAEMILYNYQGLRMWSRVIRIDEKYARDYRNNVIAILTGKRFVE